MGKLGSGEVVNFASAFVNSLDSTGQSELSDDGLGRGIVNPKHLACFYYVLIVDFNQVDELLSLLGRDVVERGALLPAVGLMGDSVTKGTLHL